MKRMCIRIDVVVRSLAHPPSTLQPLVHFRNHLRPQVRFTSNSEFPAHHKRFQVKAYFQLTGPFLGEGCHKRASREIHERSMYFPRKKKRDFESSRVHDFRYIYWLNDILNKFFVFWGYIYINMDQVIFFLKLFNYFSLFFKWR